MDEKKEEVVEKVETVEETEEVEVEDKSTDTESDALQKEREARKNQEIRAKKAEDELKRLKAEEEKRRSAPSKDNLSTRDVVFLAKTDIHDDDIAEVIEYAQLRKIPVSDAYKFMKPILDVRTEERKTALATQTKGGQRGISKTNPTDILRKAESTGEVPETTEGMQDLFRARMARKLPHIYGKK